MEIATINKSESLMNEYRSSHADMMWFYAIMGAAVISFAIVDGTAVHCCFYHKHNTNNYT